jgi:hypothetical protein
MKDYMTDVVVIWQLEDDVAVDDVDTLHVNRMDYSESHKYRNKGFTGNWKANSSNPYIINQTFIPKAHSCKRSLVPHEKLKGMPP